jgi:hypothetical protein
MRVRRSTINNYQIGAHFVSNQKGGSLRGRLSSGGFYRPNSAPRCMNMPPWNYEWCSWLGFNTGKQPKSKSPVFLTDHPNGVTQPRKEWRDQSMK